MDGTQVREPGAGTAGRDFDGSPGRGHNRRVQDDDPSLRIQGRPTRSQYRGGRLLMYPVYGRYTPAYECLPVTKMFTP